MRAARQLQCLRIQRFVGARPDAARSLEQLPRIVAARIGLRRRSSELHFRIEHSIEQRLRRRIDAGRDDRAKTIPREGDRRPRETCARERLRIAEISRREDVGGFALFDSLAQQARGAERCVDGGPPEAVNACAISAIAPRRLPAASRRTACSSAPATELAAKTTPNAIARMLLLMAHPHARLGTLVRGLMRPLAPRSRRRAARRRSCSRQSPFVPPAR